MSPHCVRGIASNVPLFTHTHKLAVGHNIGSRRSRAHGTSGVAHILDGQIDIFRALVQLANNLPGGSGGTKQQNDACRSARSLACSPANA